MPNRSIIFSETVGTWIAPRDESYDLITGLPKKEGDEVIIVVNGARRRVMLCVVHGAVRSSQWLVDLGPA